MRDRPAQPAAARPPLGMGLAPLGHETSSSRPAGPASFQNPPPVSEPVRAPGGDVGKGGIPLNMSPTTMLAPPVRPMGGGVPSIMGGPLDRPY